MNLNMDNSGILNSMDVLEPWNMFTNDFVAEETDEILTDDIIKEYETEAGELAQVKEEPEDYLDDEDGEANRYITPVINEKSKTPVLDEPRRFDAGDDTIFNFGLEPLAHITRSVSAATAPADVNEDSSESDTAVSYESSVVYICPACGSEFDTQETWKRHMNGVHNFNTRRGLNFVQLDKLYHECLECNRRIAMHSMENLLKHKFTHLPYRCTKCRVCLRQYKYRQDLMVHLRMTHREDLVARAKVDKAKLKEKSAAPVRLEIKDIKENAIDIFESTFEGIEVKNELIEPDDNDIDEIGESPSSSFVLSSFLEDALSRGSSQASERPSGIAGNEEEACEKYVQYICPQCGTEYGTKAQWRQHIDFVHNFGTRKGLNFQETNRKHHAQCLECKNVIYVNGIITLQLHKFTHLRYKSWMRCKLCFRSFAGHKEMIKHLVKQHRLGGEYDGDESQDVRTATEENEEDQSADDTLLTDSSAKSEERDVYEPHIDYLCPQCGKEFLEKKLWRKHIVIEHQLTDLQVLNFKIINDRQVMCLECDKIITNAYGVQNAQQHRITHMPFKAFARCRMCAKSYTDRKGLVKHLRSVHRIGEDFQAALMPTSAPSHSSHTPVHRPVPAIHLKPSHPQKEIVKHANITFEIKYLDDEDDIMDDAPVPELSFSHGFDQFSNLKCVDCGSIFATPNALQAHIKKEHDFLDYTNPKPQSGTPKSSCNTSSYSRSSANTSNNAYGARNSSYNNQSRSDHKSNESHGGLIPSCDEEISYSSASDDWDIEKHFCYLCPACGAEFKVQVDWRRHINGVHNFDKRHYLSFRQVDRFRYQCMDCKDIVCNPKLKALQDHKFRHLPHRLYIRCLLCGTSYNHKPNMITHLEKRHNIVDIGTPPVIERDISYRASPKPRPASNSSIPVAAAATLAKPPGLKTVEDYISFHNAVDHESISYFCPQCNENFDTHVFWRKHIVEEHNLNSRNGLNFRQIDEHHYLCLQCYKRVTVTHTKGAIGQLQSHKFRHLPYKSFKCVKCNGEFVRKQMFFKHLSKVTNTCESRPITAEDREPIEKVALDIDMSRDDEPTISDSLIVNQSSFVLICPQCGLQYESQRMWREHINIEHDLGKRESLNFRKLKPMLHQCRECYEHVSGNKLRDLQIHKFKHLAFGAYIQCKFCPTAYTHIRNMQDHLRQKHPNVVQKHEEYATMEELQHYEESALTDNESNDIEQSEEAYLLG